MDLQKRSYAKLTLLREKKIAPYREPVYMFGKNIIAWAATRGNWKDERTGTRTTVISATSR
ncbi:hypothetical protein EMIT07CA2_30051 [Brevibacillus sp. IT-7CA2]